MKHNFFNLLQYKLDGQNIKLLLFDSINPEHLDTTSSFAVWLKRTPIMNLISFPKTQGNKFTGRDQRLCTGKRNLVACKRI